jgi:hypothetical protein
MTNNSFFERVYVIARQIHLVTLMALLQKPLSRTISMNGGYAMNASHAWMIFLRIE